MRLIGLNGPKGAGKDTIGRFLAETQGYVQDSFAGPLKRAAAALMNAEHDIFNDPLRKDRQGALGPRWTYTPRYIVDELGAALRHGLGDEILIHLMADRLFWRDESVSSMHIAGIVITDVRLQAEAAWIRSQGGAIWHIHRPGYLPEEGPSLYESGLPICRGDLTLNNDGDIDELHDLIAAHLEMRP